MNNDNFAERRWRRRRSYAQQKPSLLCSHPNSNPGSVACRYRIMLRSTMKDDFRSNPCPSLLTLQALCLLIRAALAQNSNKCSCVPFNIKMISLWQDYIILFKDIYIYRGNVILKGKSRQGYRNKSTKTWNGIWNVLSHIRTVDFSDVWF